MAKSTPMSLRMLLADAPSVPMMATWYISDLAEAKGRQELYTKQSLQLLEALREHAIVESALASGAALAGRVLRALEADGADGKPVPSPRAR